MKRIYLYFISCIMVVTGLCTSCDAQLEQMNPNKATEDTFWQTEADFELALTSCYTPLKNALNGGILWNSWCNDAYCSCGRSGV